MSPGQQLPEGEERPAGLAGTVLRGAGMAGAGFAFGQALNLAFYIVLARMLSPEEFGVYAAASILLGFTYLLNETGMASAIIQRRDRVEEAQSTAVVATWTGGVILTIAAAAVAPLVGLIFDSDQIAEVSLAMSGTVFIAATGIVPDAILQRRFSFLRRMVIEPIQVVVFGTVTVILAAHDHGVWSLVIGQYSGFAVAAISTWLFAGWLPKLRDVSVGMWRELVSYGRHIFAATAILQLGEQAADTAIVGTGLGTAALGQYRYAFRIASTPFAVILAGASYVIFPAFSRIAEDAARLRSAFLRSLRWVCAIGFPAGMILVPLGPALAVLVFGDVWLPAGEAAVAICGYTGATAISSVVSEALKADGRPERLVHMHSLTAGVTIAAMLALLPLGLTAVAAGLSIGAVAGAAYSLRAARQVLGVPLEAMVREIWPPLAASVVMALVLLPIDRLVLDPASRETIPGLALVGLEGIAGIALFALVLHLLAPGTIGELVETLKRRGRSAAIEPAEHADPPSEADLPPLP